MARNIYDAFVFALVLAVSADSEENSAKAVALAQDFAASLTAKQRERGKMQALQMLGQEEV